MIKRVGEVYKMKRTVFSAICVLILGLMICPVIAKAVVDSRPNVTVSTIKLDKSQIKKHKVTVVYSIKNTGTSAAAASVAKIEMGKDDEIVQGTVPVPALKPGQIYTNTVNYNVAEGKKYLVKVTADYKNTINESNELDNENKVSFSVGRSF